MSLEEARLNPRKPFAKVKTEDELVRLLSGIRLPVLMMGGMHDPICLPENMIRSCADPRKPGKTVMVWIYRRAGCREQSGTGDGGWQPAF